MPAIEAMKDDVTTGAEARARARASREKFFPSPRSEFKMSINLETEILHLKAERDNLLEENQQLKAKVAWLESKANPSGLPEPEEVYREPKVGDIQRALCAALGISRLELISSRRTQDFVTARHIGFVLCYLLTKRSLPDIGHRFGGKDHTTVLHGLRKMADFVAALQRRLDKNMDANAAVATALRLHMEMGGTIDFEKWKSSHQRAMEAARQRARSSLLRAKMSAA